jgi:exodeoxyribonuclease VII large subunit
LRAPTPSAAAELVVERKDAFAERLAQHAKALRRAVRERVLELRHRFVAAAGSYVFREPRNLVRLYRERLGALQGRARHQLEGRVRERQQRVDDLGLRMGQQVRQGVAAWARQVTAFERHLAALSPLAVLRRGYSVTETRDGRVVRRAGAVRPGDALRTRLWQGRLESEVLSVHEEENR